MQTIEYIKAHGIGKLVSEFSIKVKEYDEGLIVLGYDQIESPKAHPIVMECRGLILDKEYNVVSRGFDRFFNLGEQPQTQEHIDWSKAYCVEKVDGSLIKIYYWKGKWYVSTRGTAFAESTVNGFLFKAINSAPAVFADGLECKTERDFQWLCNGCLMEDTTYIFELTSTENRVVKVYEGYKLHFLGSRKNTFPYAYTRDSGAAFCMGAVFPRTYKFDNAEACINTALHLKDLDEGYVLWQDGRPVCKIKSPAYVAVHHIRGEGLNPKRISQLVLTGEEEEYLTYFPEDRQHIEPYVKAKEALMNTMKNVYDSTREIESQKEFALAVKDYPFSGVLFQARKQCSPNWRTHLEYCFNDQSDPSKIRMLEAFIND